tara:strand:+ start:17689 stop:18516 length:828 start_codon:yes stop_codon:yes gene_type:complete
MEHKIINPKTNRYVLKTGKIGKELIKRLDKNNNCKINIRLNDDILYYITSHIEFDLFVISKIIKVSKLYKKFYLKYKKEISIYIAFSNNIINNNYINILIDRITIINNLYLKRQKFIKTVLFEDKCNLSFKYENSNNYTIILYDIYELMLLAIDLKFGIILKKIEEIAQYYKENKLPNVVVDDYISYIFKIAKYFTYEEIKIRSLIKFHKMHYILKLIKISLFSLLNRIIQENNYSNKLNRVLKIKLNELTIYLIYEKHFYPINFCNKLIKINSY